MQRLTKVGLLTVLFLLGIAINNLVAHKGFMPLDHSIIYDGAWRITNGQVIFRDFYTPNGLVPIWLQSLFFQMFGVNWFSYCLHSSIINGLFSALVFLFLLEFRLSKTWSFVFAILSAVVMYPPIGTPFMEQHAFFFCLLAIFCTQKTSNSPKWQIVYLICIPIFLAAAYLSKQIPSVFCVPPIILMLWRYHRGQILKMILGLLMGGAIVLLLTFSYFAYYQIDMANFYYYFFQLPSATGRKRLATLGNPIVLAKHLAVFAGIVLYSDKVFVLSFIVFTVSTAFFGYHLIRKKITLSQLANDYFPFVMAVMLVLVCWCFIALTGNQRANGIPYIFIAIALLLSTIETLAQKKILQASVAHKIFWIFIVVAILDAAYFHIVVNNKRIVHEIQFSNTTTESLTMLPHLQWQTPLKYDYPASEVEKVVEFLKKSPHNFFVIGDSSILYALANKSSVNPVLWFHYGLTFPHPDSPERKRYDDLLQKNFQKYSPMYIVVENFSWIAHLNGELKEFSVLYKDLEPCYQSQHFTIYSK